MYRRAYKLWFNSGKAPEDRGDVCRLIKVEKEGKESLWTARVAERRTASSYNVQQPLERRLYQ
jgi:hypothetical protein